MHVKNISSRVMPYQIDAASITCDTSVTHITVRGALSLIRTHHFDCYTREKDGAEGRNRTADTTIFSRMLYRLSYLGTEAKCILRGRAVPVKTSRQ